LISPLRYPGGKTRAVKHILPHFPENVKRVCSPFVGGASLELALAKKGVEVYGYDLFWPLYNFWHCAANHNKELVHEVYKLKPLTKEKFLHLRKLLAAYQHYRVIDVNYAAAYYAINRSSFSGGTLSGGFSRQAEEKRFNENAIKRLSNYEEPNFKAGYAPFEVSLEKHKDSFIYLDPPYLLENKSNKLYGVSGDLHQEFPHKRLHKILTKRRGWIMSYNDSEEIRQMYSDYDIIEAEWAMGMKNVSSPAVVEEKKFLQRCLDDIEGNKKKFKSHARYKKQLQEWLEELKKPQGKSSEILIIAK